jgi:hypothetical protein
MFDGLHEFCHCGQHPDQLAWAIIEASETSPERRQSAEELSASRFAGEVILGGQAEILTKECVAAAQGSIERLKSVVPAVARHHGVSVSGLANYVAFRLSIQKQNWWGVAHNLQEDQGDPWSIARDLFMSRVDWSRLNPVDRGILQNALLKEIALTE